MTDYLVGLFRDAGFPQGRHPRVSAGRDRFAGRALQGDGSGGKPILLMAHMDVVTADPKDWTARPVHADRGERLLLRPRHQRREGRRGDVVTSTFLRLKAEGFVPTRDLVIVFTGDEETEMATTQDLVDQPPRPDRRRVRAQRRRRRRHARRKRHAAHLQHADRGEDLRRLRADRAQPGRPQLAAAPRQRDLRARRRAEERAGVSLPDHVERHHAGGVQGGRGKSRRAKLGEAMRAFAKNPQRHRGRRSADRDSVPVGRIRTTCVATMLRGGHAKNALPQSATANINCRIFPGVADRPGAQDAAGPGRQERGSHHARTIRPPVTLRRCVRTSWPP